MSTTHVIFECSSRSPTVLYHNDRCKYLSHAEILLKESGGTPEELLRESGGTPEELLRESGGTPEELLREFGGTTSLFSCDIIDLAQTHLNGNFFLLGKPYTPLLLLQKHKTIQ
jgi:hypothetical protein